MKVVAVIQARLSSKRLPGKVILKALDKELILHQIERVRKSKYITDLVVATSDDGSDDNLAALLKEKSSVKVYRGSLENVLERIWCSVRDTGADHIVRLTGDCPIIDWNVIDDLIQFHVRGDFDYSSNALEPTLPDGMDAEVITYGAFMKNYELSQTKFEKEHVTPFIYNNQSLFKIGVKKYSENLSDLRLTVDEPEDYELINKLFQVFGNNDFVLSDILKELERDQSLKQINNVFERNEGSKNGK